MKILGGHRHRRVKYLGASDTGESGSWGPQTPGSQAPGGHSHRGVKLPGATCVGELSSWGPGRRYPGVNQDTGESILFP